MWRRIRKFFSGLITSILFVVLTVTLFSVISYQASGGEPNVFGYQLKTVLSGSMEPEFQAGSMIAIKPTEDPTQFETGDIITFINPDDNLVTHRVHEVNNEGQQYITKGDSNNTVDPEPIIAENIVGEYTGFTIPYVGYVINFAASPEGALYLLVVPGALLIGYSIFIIGRALRQLEPPSKEKSSEAQ